VPGSRRQIHFIRNQLCDGHLADSQNDQSRDFVPIFKGNSTEEIQMLIEGAIEGLTGLHPNLFLPHIIASTVAVMRDYSSSPCEFEVTVIDIAELPADETHSLRVYWQAETEAMVPKILATHHSIHIVEFAAIGIGGLLVPKVLGGAGFRTAQIGNGADYRNEDWEYMVEVTGTQTASSLTSLHQRKVEQLVYNRYKKPGYVVACSFDAKKIICSYHLPEE
jgi:hypothetical protein